MRYPNPVPFVALALLGACTGTTDPGAELTVTVAPLQLAGIADVEYHLRVDNALGDIVWDQPNLLSTRYGDGRGALTYIGPCDASADANPHTVSLWITDVTDTDGHVLSSPDEWKNPTREPNGNDPGVAIQRSDVVCAENADVRVDFDLTVMRAAGQGFFDVAVNFEDVFCAAKMDCIPEMLHDPARAGTPRGPTVVLGFACTSGTAQGAPEPTHLYLSDLLLRCDKPGSPVESFETRLPVDAVVSDGNQGAVARGVFQWARYQDQEEFQAIDKCFWNFAVGLDTSALAGFECDLVANGTASARPLVANLLPDAVHPYLSWDVQVLGSGGALCEPNALDAIGSGVSSEYHHPNIADDILPFSAHYLCGDEPTAPPLACVPAVGEAPALQVAPRGTSGLDVSGGGAPVPFTLPPGWALGSACSADTCCN